MISCTQVYTEAPTKILFARHILPFLFKLTYSKKYITIQSILFPGIFY